MLEKVDICRYERQKLQRFFILQKHLQKLQEHTSLIVSYLLALCSVQKTLCNICLWNIMSLNEQLRDMLLTRNALTGFVSRDLNTKEQAPLGSLKRLWTDLCKAAVGIDSKGKKKKLSKGQGIIWWSQWATENNSYSRTEKAEHFEQPWVWRIWEILDRKTGKNTILLTDGIRHSWYD